jgi:hypothetical protein
MKTTKTKTRKKIAPRKQGKGKVLKMRSWMKYHSAFTLLLFAIYATMGVFGGFDVLGNDLKQKYAEAATTISAIVIAQPEVPEVTVVSACSAENVQEAQISWTDSVATNNFDVYKDGELLVSGLVATSFIDTMVDAESTYVYRVQANNDNGVVQSQDASVTIARCSDSPPPIIPVVSLVSFDGKDAIFSNNLLTSNRSPKITGTTNIPNAKVQIKVFPGPIVSSTTHANSNGSWDYTVPMQLGYGHYYFQITSTNPNNHNMTKTIDRSFEIAALSTPSEKKHTTHSHKNSAGVIISPSNGNGSNLPNNDNENNEENNNGNEEGSNHGEQGASFSAEVFVNNKDGKVYSSQSLDIGVSLKGDYQKNLLNMLNVKYEILNANGEIVFSENSQQQIFNGRLQKNVNVPANLPFGKYVIRIMIQQGEIVITGDGRFLFEEKPIINLGGGTMLTYSQLISNLGWVVLVGLFSMIVLSIMFILEYHVLNKGILTVAEENLLGRGLITKGKGVPR